MRCLPRQIHQKGAAIIGLVAAVLLFSVLAAALVPMISTSNQQSMAGNLSAKSYLLAESGYRYAASRFLHAGATEQEQNQILEGLDGDYALDGNDGSFNLQVFSYFYTLSQPVNGQNLFTANVPGNYPGAGTLPEDAGDEVVLSSGLKIRLGDQTYTLDSRSAQASDDSVDFEVTTPLASYPADTPVYPVADVNLGSNTTLNDGDNLTYEANDALMFPLRNGMIQINGRTMTYRFNNRAANRFEDVRAPVGQIPLAGFDLTADPQIVLTRYVRLHATGIYGSGAAANQVRRRVVYYTPLPQNTSDPQQREFTDQFNPGEDNWSDTPGTTTSIRNQGGDSALTIDATATIGTDQKGASITFTPGSEAAENINFSSAQQGTRGYLSYDTQIKVGYDPIPAPANGYSPGQPIPAYVGAGLTFRKEGAGNVFNNNGYKLSIMRGNNNLAGDDGIPDALVPLQNERAIVLWRQTDTGGERTWLAYKRLADPLIDGDGDPLLVEDSETRGSNAFNDGFGGTDQWDLEPVVEGSPSRQRDGSTRNWYFGLTASHTYDLRSPPGPPGSGTGIASSGNLTSDTIALPAGAPPTYLTFWSWHQTEPGSPTRSLDTYDLKQIIILGTPITTYTIAAETLTGPDIIVPPGPDGWYQARINLSSYRGQSIRIRFRFRTGDGIENAYEGWYVDDIQLNTPWTVDEIQEATLALGLKEAMVVPFNNGDAQIRQGDRVFGARGSAGTVLIPPMISSGTWAGDDASGTLLLNRTDVRVSGDPFEAGEELFAIGSTGHARVSAWSLADDNKANLIQVYLATRTGRGIGGNDNPLDNNTEPYGRLGLTALTELQWPPVLDDSGNWTDDDGAWETSEDYFQLIKWDAINSNASGLSQRAFTVPGQGVVRRAVLQSTHPDLITPDYPGLFEQSEIGLHAVGDGADNIYFDDFGIRLNVFDTDVLPSPIQQ